MKRSRELSVSSVDSGCEISDKLHKKVKYDTEFMTSYNFIRDRQEQIYDDKQIKSCSTFTRKQQTGSVTQNVCADALLLSKVYFYIFSFRIQY